jgi:hypothetical protein
VFDDEREHEDGGEWDHQVVGHGHHTHGTQGNVGFQQQFE